MQLWKCLRINQIVEAIVWRNHDFHYFRVYYTDNTHRQHFIENDVTASLVFTPFGLLFACDLCGPAVPLFGNTSHGLIIIDKTKFLIYSCEVTGYAAASSAVSPAVSPWIPSNKCITLFAGTCRRVRDRVPENLLVSLDMFNMNMFASCKDTSPPKPNPDSLSYNICL